MNELNTVDEWITNYVYLVKIGRAVMLLSGWRPGSNAMQCVALASARVLTQAVRVSSLQMSAAAYDAFCIH